MKLQFLLLFAILFGCETKTKPIVLTNNESKDETFKLKEFYIGDINNDKINDTAFADKSIIRFSSSTPSIDFENTSIYIKKIDDLNNDDANEIIVFSRTNEGGGIIFPFGLLKMVFGKKLQNQKHLFLKTKILTIE